MKPKVVRPFKQQIIALKAEINICENFNVHASDCITLTNTELINLAYVVSKEENLGKKLPVLLKIYDILLYRNPNISLKISREVFESWLLLHPTHELQNVIYLQ